MNKMGPVINVFYRQNNRVFLVKEVMQTTFFWIYVLKIFQLKKPLMAYVKDCKCKM